MLFEVRLFTLTLSITLSITKKRMLEMLLSSDVAFILCLDGGSMVWGLHHPDD